MVKHSLDKMIDKYPFFFDKRPISNFFKITKVYNENFKLMYNDLFKVYESFHINKRLFIWKEQSEPYSYTVHFLTKYPNIKSVSIYKNDDLIKFEEFDELNAIDEYLFDYHAEYIKENIQPLELFECDECGEIIYGYDNISICENCGNNSFEKVTPYKCDECGEIYYKKVDDTDRDCIKNNHQDSLKLINAFYCLKCNEIIYSEYLPLECPNCYVEDYTNLGSWKITGEWNDIIDVDERTDFEVYVLYNTVVMDKVILSKDNDWEVYTQQLPIVDEVTGELINYTLKYNNDLCNVILNELEKHHTPNTEDFVPPIYSNDKSIVLIDNSENYDDEIVVSSDVIDVVEDEEGDDDEVTEIAIEIPQIPSDNFLIVVETFDEYIIEKGFPETDLNYIDYEQGLKEGSVVRSVFDHDYSLDGIGVLNNIPRKNYKVIDEPLLYPYTEPAFNNRETEDDYHYMKRMLEYNIRMWTMNPPSLELWKMYGVESRLINRERYLLKVFDENKHPFDEETGLVECWSPLAWEHKDKFCDGSKDNGEYFFVNASTVRPIPMENIICYFNILDGLGRVIEDEEYIVDIYKVITKSDKLNDIQLDLDGGVSDYDGYEIGDEFLLFSNLKDNKVKISYKAISDIKDPQTGYATNIFRFVCYKINGELLGKTDIVINVRDYLDADWFVDETANIDKETGEKIINYIGDGSLERPFLTLQECLNNVTSGLNFICLLNNINLNEPLIIPTSCIILGKNNYITDGNDEIRIVPRIFQNNVEVINEEPKYDKRFFKLIGNKNCRLLLSNLRLVSGGMNSYISINSWLNNNSTIDNYENVIIHGGGVIINVTLNYDNYYPFDYVEGELLLYKSDGVTILPESVVKLYYNDEVYEFVTDEEGKIDFKFNLNEEKQGLYNIIFKNVSDVYFEIDKTVEVSAQEEYSEGVFIKYKGETVTLHLNGYESNTEVNLYLKDGEVFDTCLTDEYGSVEYTFEPEFGEHLIYTTFTNSYDDKVFDEWLINSICNVSDFVDKLSELMENPYLIIDASIDEDGVLTYDTREISDDITIDDLDNVLLNIEYDKDNDELILERFYVSESRSGSTYLKYSEIIELRDAVYDVKFEDGDIITKSVGEF